MQWIYLIVSCTVLAQNSCFHNFQPAQTIQSLCCYPVVRECFDELNPPQKCCPFAELPQRQCTEGCEIEDLLPNSLEPFVRFDSHNRTIDLYIKLASDATEVSKCTYQEALTLFYGYMKAGNELGISQAKELEGAALPRLWRALQRCDMTDEEMWQVSHVTRPLMSYLIRHKNHFEEISDHGHLERFSRNVVPAGVTAWDIGASDGQDSLYFLTSDFDKVLSVEPSPPTVQYLKRRLKPFGWRTVLIDKAVVAAETQTIQHNVDFSFYAHHSQASQVASASAAPGAVFPVGTTNCRSLAEVFGIPWTVKIDAEDVDPGKEQVCLADLCSRGYIPQYVSLETSSISHIRQLFNCGYRKFKLVAQGQYSLYSPKDGTRTIHRTYNQPLQQGNSTLYQFTSSGPTGEDALDWVSGHNWRTAADVADDLSLISSARANPAMNIIHHIIFGTKGNGVEWFDVHAKLN